MKTILKFLALGAVANLAVEVYRRKQRWDRELAGSRGERRGLGSMADTNAAASGDAERALEESQRPRVAPLENSTP